MGQGVGRGREKAGRVLGGRGGVGRDRVGGGVVGRVM